MTRIVLVAGTYQPNHCGVAHYTHHLRQALHQHQVESVVLTTCEAANKVQEPSVFGVVPDWTLRSLLPLVRAIHQTNANLLHMQHAAGTYQFERAIFLLPLLLRLTGWRSPIVSTIHEYGWWEWQPQWCPAPVLESLKAWGQNQGWWDREDGFLLTQSDAIVTTNRNATQVIHARLPQLRDRLHEIPIGANIGVASIDRAAAQRQVRQVCGWSEKAVIITFFGFLHPVKGLETLLPAFQQVATMHPQARLLLVGGVESLALPDQQAKQYWQKLTEAIAQLNLQNQVYRTGYVDDCTASQYLSGSDIGVLPFNHGVTLKSGSLLAMMAHGLPVIATRSHPPDPDLDEMLIPQVAPRDVDELAMELNRLLKDSSLREQLGTAGTAFSQKFSWAAIASAHTRIYQTLFKSR
ncbi:MAG: glycosyltransferase family 4 protein [Oscillatoriales cyanobacterium C42_A2020_001]|nr:glycosyltransferase family 4 protein [Leptolyngbyaceae cyanobacterium C42_A2020_001]